MNLRDKYNHAIQTAKGYKMQGSAEERDGKLYFKGVVQSQDEVNKIWDAIKTVPDWRNDIVGQVTIDPNAKPAATAAASTYTVKAGDTLSKIAKDHLGDANAYMKIFNANKDQLTDPDKIKPGQVLKIPDRCMSERLQLLWLFVLAAPIACVAWTVTHEELFREIRDWCASKSERCPRLYQRKFFYLFTCEYCFSHYVAAAVVLMTGYRLLLPDWRGAVLGWFTLVWIANVYMSLFGRLRLDIKRERVEIKLEEREVEKEDGSGAATPKPMASAPRLAAAARPPARPANRA